MLSETKYDRITYFETETTHEDGEKQMPPLTPIQVAANILLPLALLLLTIRISEVLKDQTDGE